MICETTHFLQHFVILQAVTTLIGCERSGRTNPPKIYQKEIPPTQEITLFLHQDVDGMSKRKEKNLKGFCSLGCCRLWKYRPFYFYFLEIKMS